MVILLFFHVGFSNGFIFKIIKFISLFLQLKMGGQKAAAPIPPFPYPSWDFTPPRLVGTS